jgi:hypothetical protein
MVAHRDRGDKSAIEALEEHEQVRHLERLEKRTERLHEEKIELCKRLRLVAEEDPDLFKRAITADSDELGGDA